MGCQRQILAAKSPTTVLRSSTHSSSLSLTTSNFHFSTQEQPLKRSLRSLRQALGQWRYWMPCWGMSRRSPKIGRCCLLFPPGTCTQILSSRSAQPWIRISRSKTRGAEQDGTRHGPRHLDSVVFSIISSEIVWERGPGQERTGSRRASQCR